MKEVGQVQYWKIIRFRMNPKNMLVSSALHVCYRPSTDSHQDTQLMHSGDLSARRFTYYRSFIESHNDYWHTYCGDPSVCHCPCHCPVVKVTTSSRICFTVAELLVDSPVIVLVLKATTTPRINIALTNLLVVTPTMAPIKSHHDSQNMYCAAPYARYCPCYRSCIKINHYHSNWLWCPIFTSLPLLSSLYWKHHFY